MHLERLADRCRRPSARVERRVRVLEHDLHVAPSAAQLAVRERARCLRPSKLDRRRAVGSSSRSTRRATVDLPEPLSPTRPSVSPLLDRRSRRRRPRARGRSTRRRTLLCTGNDLQSSRTESCGVPVVSIGGRRPRSRPRRVPAPASARSVNSSERAQRASPAPSFVTGRERHVGAATLVLGVAAASCEAAADRDLARPGNDAGYHRERLAERRDLRHRREQSFARTGARAIGRGRRLRAARRPAPRT